MRALLLALLLLGCGAADPPADSSHAVNHPCACDSTRLCNGSDICPAGLMCAAIGSCVAPDAGVDAGADVARDAVSETGLDAGGDAAEVAVDVPEELGCPAGWTFDWCRDVDHDGHGDPATRICLPRAATGYVQSCDDCNDADPAIHPGAWNSCDETIRRDCSAPTAGDAGVDAAGGDAGVCPALRGDCDGTCANGCETDLNTHENCGACGRRCGTRDSCDMGVCRTTCAATCIGPNFACCYPGACINLNTGDSNCGACGHSCGSGQRCCRGACTTDVICL